MLFLYPKTKTASQGFKCERTPKSLNASRQSSL
nr:MAG TPA: hypothetical protein [Caudoviricetes sp.]